MFFVVSFPFRSPFTLPSQMIETDKTSKCIQTSLTLFPRLLTMCLTVFLDLWGDICDLPKVLVHLSYMCPGAERKRFWI